MSLISRILGRDQKPAPAKRKRSPIPNAGRRPGSRSYAAAAVDRLTADLVSVNTTAGSELRRALALMRARSRDLERNNDYARRFFGLLQDNVVGSAGVKLQMDVRTARGRPDDVANRRIEEAWRRWQRVGSCTVDGRLSWCDAQRLFIRSVARDGEAFVRHVVGRGAENPFNYALQFVESDHLDENNCQSAKGGTGEIYMSVELNEWGRPVAYHVTPYHPGDDSFRGRSYGQAVRVPAREMIHGFLCERITQTRGAPWIVSALVRLAHLERYEEAEVVAARLGASKMGFYYTETGDEYQGDEDEDDEGGPQLLEFEPGIFEELPDGTKFEGFDPQHPNSAFDSFVKSVLRGVASGLNVSYNSLANDLEGVNYSSIRHGALTERDTWRALQTWTIEHFHEQVFRRWLPNAILTGEVNLRMGDLNRYLDGVRWRPRGWQWVDPLKEVTAHEKAIANRLNSRSRIVAEQGGDFDEILADVARENEAAATAGVDLATGKSEGGKSPGGQENDDEDEDESGGQDDA